MTSVADIIPILKNLWPQDRVINEVYPDHPFLARVPKMEEFGAEDIRLAVRIGDPQGRGITVASAQARDTSSAFRRFVLTRSRNYQIFRIEAEAIEASRGDVNALVSILDDDMRGAINNISKDLAVNLFRGRSGVLGSIGAIAAGPPATITLSNAADVTSFEVGMVLVAATGVTAANRSTPATATITRVDRSTGVLTFADGTFAGTNWAANDFLYVQGDKQDGANASAVGNKALGLADWLPFNNPTVGENFLSVDRSVDRVRLAGLPVDISADIPEEGALRVIMELDRQGARPRDFITNHTDYQSVLNSLGTKAVTKYEGAGQIGFQTIQIMGPKGPVSMYLDQDCPAGTGYCLDMSKWKLYSLGPAPKLLNLDGLDILRLTDADTYEGRFGYYANLGTTAPGFNAVVRMPSS